LTQTNTNLKKQKANEKTKKKTRRKRKNEIHTLRKPLSGPLCSIRVHSRKFAAEQGSSFLG